MSLAVLPTMFPWKRLTCARQRRPIRVVSSTFIPRSRAVFPDGVAEPAPQRTGHRISRGSCRRSAGWRDLRDDGSSRSAQSIRQSRREPPIYSWGTATGVEVDLAVESGGKLMPIEVKLSAPILVIFACPSRPKPCRYVQGTLSSPQNAKRPRRLLAGAAMRL